MTTRKEVEDAALAFIRVLLDYLPSDAQSAAPVPAIEQPPVAPVLRFRNAPPTVGAWQVEVETTYSDVMWVMFRNDERNTWFTAPQAVPSDGKFIAVPRHNGDKVKLFTADKKNAVDSASMHVTLPQASNAILRVNQFLDGLTGGVNIERELSYEFSQDEHSYVRKQVSMDSARVFLPWRPTGGYAANDGTTWKPPTQATVERFVSGISRMRVAGYKRVFADCSDVITDADVTPEGVRLITETCEMVAKEAVKQGLGADFLCIGPVNEWACSLTNVHANHNAFLAALRKHLPQHVLSFGPSYWKYWGMLVEHNQFVPPKDELAVCDVHSYVTQDAAGWSALSSKLMAWEAKWQRRIVFGEAGPGQLHRDEQNYLAYPANIRTMMPIMRRFVPMTWAVSKGSHWRLNHNGGELMNKQPYAGGGNAPDVVDALLDALALR